MKIYFREDMTINLANSQKHQPYLINVGEADKTRASALNLIFDPHSLDFFPFDKIKNHDKILFAGCGNGQLVVEIAKRIQTENLIIQLVAFDISQEQLNCAQKYAEQENIQNIQWKLCDAHQLEEFKGLFNIVHARFLLNHLAEAELVTKLLCTTLANDGIFIAEEFAGDELDVLPECNEYMKAVNTWVKGIRFQHILQKSDMAFAKYLPEILENIKMTIIRKIQPLPIADNIEQKNIFPLSLQQNSHRFFSLDKHHQIPAIIAALEHVRDAKDCSIIFKHFTQIEAKKTF